MRLDLVLKQAGIIKRRTIAKELAEKGRISINNRVAKPSSEVKEDDVLSLRLGTRFIEVKITYVNKGKREYPIFQLLSSEKVKNES
ncbi:MAG: S4 domain-containing protein [Bacilli bacterium]